MHVSEHPPLSQRGQSMKTLPCPVPGIGDSVLYLGAQHPLRSIFRVSGFGLRSWMLDDSHQYHELLSPRSPRSHSAAVAEQGSTGCPVVTSYLLGILCREPIIKLASLALLSCCKTCGGIVPSAWGILKLHDTHRAVLVVRYVVRDCLCPSAQLHET